MFGAGTMFRPLAFQVPPRRRAYVATALLCAACAWTIRAIGGPSDEPAQVYTDEDLKSLHRGKRPEEEPPPERLAPYKPQTQPQTQPQTRPQAPPQTQPDARSQTRPSSQTRPLAPPQTGVTSAPPAPGSTPPPTPGGPAGDDWAQEWKHDDERRNYWERRIRAAEGRVAGLERRLEYLNRKKASIQNPFLPRPELTPEDQAAEEGLDGAARISRVEEQISQARQDLEEARRAVERARAEAEQALAPPDATGLGNTTN